MCGCVSHPERMQTVKQGIAKGNFSQKILPKFDKGDVLLCREEAGRFFQIAGMKKRSSKEYQKAIEIYNAQKEKASVVISDGAKTAWAASFANDLALEYVGGIFENTMCYTLESFNAIAKEEFDDFGVGVRNLIENMSSGAAAYKREMRLQSNALRTEEESIKDRSKRINKQQLEDKYNKLQTKSALASALDNPAENAYSYILSGLYYELTNNSSDAARVYTRALELSGCESLLRHMIDRNSNVVGEEADETKTKGEVIVFFEDGYIQPKQENSFSLITYIGSVKTAIPYYSPLRSYDRRLSIYLGADKLCDTVEVSDFRVNAVRELSDKMPLIIARQTTRTITKAIVSTTASVAGYSMMSNSNNNGDALVGLALILGGMVYANTSEQADLRSWLLLPRSGQVARFYLEEGESALSLKIDGISMEIKIPVEKGRKTVLHCIRVPGAFTASATLINEEI